jgi:hypothetical protein
MLCKVDVKRCTISVEQINLRLKRFKDPGTSSIGTENKGDDDVT